MLATFIQPNAVETTCQSQHYTDYNSYLVGDLRLCIRHIYTLCFVLQAAQLAFLLAYDVPFIVISL